MPMGPECTAVCVCVGGGCAQVRFPSEAGAPADQIIIGKDKAFTFDHVFQPSRAQVSYA